MHTHPRLPAIRSARQPMLALALACGLALTAPAQAEIKGLEIIAPAGRRRLRPAGPRDAGGIANQRARLRRAGQNIPGAGGTIGLAQFVTKGARSNS